MKELISTMLTEKEIGFDSTESEDSNIFSFFFTEEMVNGTVKGVIGVNYYEEQVIILASHPTNIPEPKRIKVAELITRINNNDFFGGFVLDFEDGLMGYQAAFLFEDNKEVSQKHLIRYFETCLARLDYYLPVILKVAFGEKDPSIVLDELEHQIDPRMN